MKNKNSLDIAVPIKEEELNKCLVCNRQFSNGKMALPAHVTSHKMEFSEYLVKYYLNGDRPYCPICQKETRYNRGKYSFKKYCLDHSSQGRREWSKINGFGAKVKADWKKGLTKKTSEIIAKHSENMTGENNPFFGKKHSKETIKKISEKRAAKTRITFQEFQERKNSSNVTCLSSYEQYINSVNRNLEYICHICNNKYSASLMWHDCIICNKPSSQPEDDICKFLDDNKIKYVKNTRDIIKPQELDILIEDKKLAIEYNGLFWHSEDQKGDIRYHYNKTKACKEKNIHLVHIFSDEWLNNREIVLSILSHKLGINENIVNTRKMMLKESSGNSDLKSFFDSTHISGHATCIKAFYLINPENGEVVSALSIRRPFIKKYGSDVIEIARFSNKLNCSVPGAFSRLLKRAKSWAKENEFSKILTYADLRFGTGDVYSKNGFQYVGTTDVDYWYTNGKQRYNRFKYRAKNGKSEKQIAEESNVKRIYGCGSNIYLCNL